MSIREELEAQRRELEAAVKALPETIREIQTEAVATAYSDLIQTSPVRTGAYRSEHVIEQGEGEQLLYESPNRSGPDTPVPGNQVIFEAPSPEQAAAALSGIGNFSAVQIANRRYYAAQLEYGSASSGPRYIYTQVEERARVLVDQLAREKSERR